MTFRPIPTSLPTILSTITILLCNSAQAVAEEPPKLWSGDLEFGYVSTSGNTDETHIKSLADINREKDHWRYNINAVTSYSESSGNRTAEKYYLANRLAFQYSDNNFSFVFLSYDDDSFTGFDYQVSAVAGWGRRLINEKSMQWDIELGPGYRISQVENATGTDSTEELIARAFTRFKWGFSETAQFSQSLNTEAGNKNTISNSVTALKVKVNGSLSIKLSYSIKYVETVPSQTKHTDTTTAVTANYSF